MATSMYNHHRFARAVMKKFRKAPASLTIELHSNHWLFQGQQGKLEYDGPMRPFLQALREQAIPPSLLNTILNSSTHVPIYDGCLLIEIHDFRTSCLTAAQELANQASGSDLYQRNPFHHSKSATTRPTTTTTALNSRPAPTSALGMSGLPCSSSATQRPVAGPQTNGFGALHSAGKDSSEQDTCTKYRVVMKPDSVSMWEQLVHLNRLHGSQGEWDDQSVLQMESRILAAIAPPLALDTSFALSRTANLAIAVTAPTLPFMSWDGRYIARAERHKVEDQSVNAKQVHSGPSSTAAGESGTRKADVKGGQAGDESTSTARGKGDAATLGYEKQEIDLFAKLGKPSAEDLSEKARATWDEKASSPMSQWNWLSRTYGYHKLRRPGQEPPSNTIFTGQNTRGGAVNADASAAMMAIANERANGQAEDGGAAAAASAAAAAAAAAASATTKKKPTKKKRKDVGGEDSVRGGSVVDVKAEDSKDAVAAAEATKGKPKPKKKKDTTAANVTPTIPSKGKKRGIDEMSEAGSVNIAVPPSPSQPLRSAIGLENKSVVFSNLPPPGAAKKLTKKQQKAFDAAEREKARQQAEAAAAEQNPPKKKAKKNTAAPATAATTAGPVTNTGFTNPNAFNPTLATPLIDLVGLQDVAAPPPPEPSAVNLASGFPVDMIGQPQQQQQDYSQIMVPPNLLDPALPPHMANMPIGEVPENIFMAAAADVDFAFPFPMGGPEGSVASGFNGDVMEFGGGGSMEHVEELTMYNGMPDLSSRQPSGQSRAPPGS
ncbi:hypothetical protein QFC22_000271 [Naganishia vaughanmartiniae]|uniref:Uncharacterized protein n=1 Tax=Naganishia vaughanmartiniae TaxID=1424756 RepID=A0ACC2XPC6_9TREE|nr:hypothetical protein QFC22_000271 [Naganishia vaughanmartiniae]